MTLTHRQRDQLRQAVFDRANSAAMRAYGRYEDAEPSLRPGDSVTISLTIKISIDKAVREDGLLNIVVKEGA